MPPLIRRPCYTQPVTEVLSAEEEALLDALLAVQQGQKAREEAEELSQSLIRFVEAAWPHVEPSVSYLDNWHIHAICEHLEACSRDEIERLQIWVPRRSMKSRLVSVLWPAWEWTREPGLRYFTASYELRLAGRLSAETRDLMQSPWYRARWGQLWRFTREGERYFANNRGGTRLATGPDSSGLGEHANRILIDDIINAKEAEANSGILLTQANEWYDTTIPGTRLLRCSEVIVMQRLHENDIAAHVMDTGKPWTILCLPERFEANHPYAWRGQRVHAKVKARLPDHLRKGDPRREQELLWPVARDELASNEMAATLKSYRAAGQMQQRPAAREGEILKTDWWRFYDPRVRAAEEWDKLGRFGMIVLSVDTPLKDKQTSDNVAVQCWGIQRADRYLLDLRLGKMNYGLAKRTIKIGRAHV